MLSWETWDQVGLYFAQYFQNFRRYVLQTSLEKVWMFFEEVEKSRRHPYCHMHNSTHTVGDRGEEISIFFFQWRETPFICALFPWNSTTLLLSLHHPSSLAACYELPAQIPITCTAGSSALAGKGQPWPMRKAKTGTAENNCEEPGTAKFSCSYSSPSKDCGNSFQETPVKGHEEDVQWERCSPSPHPC